MLALCLTLSWVLSGCVRGATSDKAVLGPLCAQSQGLLAAASKDFQEFPPSRWPPGIAALAPESVYAGRTGLFIRLNLFFADESGYFVPRKGAHIRATPATDPSYETLGEGVFWYRIKG
jgi:hypothetical protein